MRGFGVGGRRGCHYNSLPVDRPVSIAIETSCRRGGVALGAGESLLETATFRSDRRHAVQLVPRLAELLGRAGLKPADLNEVYVSVGPGSFTGLRVGITVARTLAQAVAGLRCVAVPTVEAVAEHAAETDFENLGVVMDAKGETIFAAVFARCGGRVVAKSPPGLIEAGRFVAEAPRPITLIGEGLWYHDLAGEGITLGGEDLWLPTPEGVWRVGRRMAAAGQFIAREHLLPLYLRKPEAVRLWESRRKGQEG